MDRVTGWYKRRAQTIIGVLGFVIAGVINVDSITIAKSLSTNKAMRESLVAAAQVYATEYSKPQPPQENKTRSVQNPKDLFQANLSEIQKLGLPIGWNEGTDYSLKAWPFRIIGWLLTAFAVSLGAPFWFDLLNKFNVVRSAVKPEEKKPAGSS